MKGGNVNEFIDHSTYEELAIEYDNRKYFFYGLQQNQDTKLYTYEIIIWLDEEPFYETVYDTAAETKEECMAKFFDAPIFDGKKFWDAERDMEWVEIWL